MKTHIEKPQSVSHAPQSHPKASRQASILDMLEGGCGKKAPVEPLQWKSAGAPLWQLPVAKQVPAGEAIQCVRIGKENISKANLRAALRTALKSEVKFIAGHTLQEHFQRDDKTFTAAANTLFDTLWDLYQTKNFHLVDLSSLVHQVSQDINLIWGGDQTIAGTPHQHSEYAVDPANRHPGLDKDNEMRIYRSMPEYAWEAASLKGHGGSLGEAMNYFRQGKRDTATHPTHIYYLVEFRLPGKTVNGMTGDIGGGEGVQSTADKFGGKRESTSEFGIEKDFFSVDMKHADTILSTVPRATSRVIASTGAMPDVIKKPGRAWKHTNPVDTAGW